MHGMDLEPGSTSGHDSRIIRFSSLAFASLVAIAVLAGPAAAQLRIVNYNLAQLRGDPAALQYVFAALSADDRPGFAVPVSVFVFQEVLSTNVVPILNYLNAAAPQGVTYITGTYSNSNEDPYSGAQAMYYRSGMVTEIASAHVDIYTQAGRRADRWKLQLGGYTSSAAAMYIYSSHLKADTGLANEQLRLDGVIAIRANADALGSGWHIIYCGDQNFYNNTEPGYLRYLSIGAGQAFDPLGTGSWAGGAGSNPNNFKHTQSPLLTSINGLTGGGMDDRFDFQISTAAFSDGAGLSIMPGTYRAFGNDGQHYNQAINIGSNFYYPGQLARSNALATELNLASDHVPLIVDYQVPAVMTATIPANYGRVIVGAAFSVTVNVTNTANVVVLQGADVLDYTATGTQGLSGSFADSVLPLGDVSSHAYTLNTSSAAIRNGQVLLTSLNQGVQNPSLILSTTGTVVRPSNASFSSSSDVNSLTLPLQFDPNTGVHTFTVNVYNFGFDALQALLDIDSVSSLSSPFGYMGGAANNIGSTPATLTFAFDTTNLAGGAYSAPVTINTSDENLPGAVASSLNLTINVTVGTIVPCDPDITGDHVVNVNDLLAVIGAWGPCPAPPATCAADVNDDGMVNVDDLLAVIAAWGNCP